jgi:magnesium-transporting ATPase (P-type)
VLLSFFLLAICFIYANIKQIHSFLNSALIIIIFNILAYFSKALITYFYHVNLSKTSIHKTKNKLYQVIRNSNLIELEESEIVVGDVIELGFKEKVPVTGIMLSSKEIYVRESDK